VLVAAPAFLGLLRASLSAPLQSLASLEVDKDYTALGADELCARLRQMKIRGR
jgi:protein required for attachment to host cells